MNSETQSKLYEVTPYPKRSQLWSQCVKRVSIDSNEFQTHSNDFLSVSHQLTTLMTHKRDLSHSLCLDTYTNVHLKWSQLTQACMRPPKAIRDPLLPTLSQIIQAKALFKLTRPHNKHFDLYLLILVTYCFVWTPKCFLTSTSLPNDFKGHITLSLINHNTPRLLLDHKLMVLVTLLYQTDPLLFLLPNIHSYGFKYAPLTPRRPQDFNITLAHSYNMILEIK